MTSTFPLLSLLVFSPLLGVLLVLTFRDAHQGRAAQWGAVTSSLVTAILSLFVWTAFQEGTAGLQLVERFTWIGSFGIDYFLGLDGLNLFFLVAAAWLQPLILIASWNMQERAWQFNLHLLLLQCGVLGCFVALDVILFYVFFELMLIPLYFLIGGWGRAQSLVAANRFFIYTVWGSLLMLVSLIYTAVLFYQSAGYWSFQITDWYQLEIPVSTQVWLFLGMFLAFAIKIPLFPFHGWLPSFHEQAPTIGSVEMAAIMMKLGPYGFLRFALPTYPEAVALLSDYLMVLSLVCILYGGLVAIVQTNLKRLMAYSSISHMGYILLGVFALNQQGMTGGLMQMVNYAIVTSALFLCLGMLLHKSESQEIGSFGGLLKTMPIFSGFFILFSMGSIGLPGLNSFIGEVLTMIGAAKVNLWFGVFAAVGVLIAAIYMLWMVQRVLFGPATKSHRPDLGLREIVVLSPLAFLAVLLGVYPQLFFDKVEPTVSFYAQQIQVRPTLQTVGVPEKALENAEHLSYFAGSQSIHSAER
jgi:NADH-quinone oxidoreductase subunit M